MNEDDTFKKLKSATPEEIEVIYQRVWTDCCIELESYGADISGGIPIPMIRERCDKAFKPYGWSYSKLFPWNGDPS